MAVREMFSTVLLLCLLNGSISSTPPPTNCPKEVVSITVSLKPNVKQYIQTPFFPDKYPANASCTWRVTLPDSISHHVYGIGLVLVDTWEIESCYKCRCDYLAYEFSHGVVKKGGWARRTCNILSENYISSLRTSSSRSLFRIKGGKELWLRFHSDHTSQFKGFKAQLTVYNSGRYTVCNNFINDTSGSIESPHHPSPYPKGQTIVWCLAVPDGFHVKLKFSAFELDDTRNKEKDCLNDYVEIRDGGYGNVGYRNGGYGELLGRFCGNKIPTEEIYSKTNQMWVQFVSDFNTANVYKGFKAEFVSGGHFMTSSLSVCLLAIVMWLLT